MPYESTTDSSVLSIDEFLERARTLPVLDVRAPSEFAQGHIPNAISFPLFDDQERAQVGTAYKQQGRRYAIELGTRIANPKRDRFIARATELSRQGELLVHCWRGGLRSQEMARLFAEHDLRPRVLEGGYKSFRREVLESFETPKKMIVLSGYTGSGKTELLYQLREQGEQVLDLEGLAHHRGSAFGGISQPPQPTVEQFENNTYPIWQSFDASRPVFVEGESRMIGRVKLPEPLWDQLLAAPELFVLVPRESRVQWLVKEYGEFPKDELEAALHRIAKRLGGARLQAATEALQRDDVATVAQIALDYYDKSYRNASEMLAERNVTIVEAETAGDARVIPRLLELAYEAIPRI